MTRIGICKVNFEGKICHQNAYARSFCEGFKGSQCKLHQEYLSKPRSGLAEFALPEVVYHSKEHVAAVALKTEEGYQIYFRSIENEPTFLEVLPENTLFLLTIAEGKILEKVLLRMSNQEIADALYISCATVKTHMAHLYQKIPNLKSWRSKV